MCKVDDCFIHGYVFIIGCVDWLCHQSFLSRCVSFCFFPTTVFGLVVMDVFTFPCLCETNFSSQMIVKCQLVIGLR